MARREWEGRTFGTRRMHIWLIRILGSVNLRIIYVFTDIFIIPFCLIFNKSRKSSWNFYRKRLGYNLPKAFLATYANHRIFAQVVIDRFAMYAGKKFEISIQNKEEFDTRAGRPEGFVLFSSHVGNYEMAGYSITSDNKTINAVVYEYEKETVMQNRNSMFGKTNNNMIVPSKDMSHLFKITGALSEGEIVSFPCDRAPGGSRCIRRGFLGAEASFPAGPFNTTAMHGCDVLAVNVMKESAKEYKIIVTPLPYDKTLPREKAALMLAKAYIEELERILMLYPTQWFNFYDFWA